MRDRLERFQKAGKQRRGEMEALSTQLAVVQQLLAKAEQVNSLRWLLGCLSCPMSHQCRLGLEKPTLRVISVTN